MGEIWSAFQEEVGGFPETKRRLLEICFEQVKVCLPGFGQQTDLRIVVKEPFCGARADPDSGGDLSQIHFAVRIIEECLKDPQAGIVKRSTHRTIVLSIE